MKLFEECKLDDGSMYVIKPKELSYVVSTMAVGGEDWVEAFQGSLLECRSYARALLAGQTPEDAAKAAKVALERKNSRPTEAQKAHEMGMTINQYREYRRCLRNA